MLVEHARLRYSERPSAIEPEVLPAGSLPGHRGAANRDLVNSVRRWFGVRFPWTLPLLQLSGIPFGIAHNQVRDGLGFGRHVEWPQGKLLRFFH